MYGKIVEVQGPVVDVKFDDKLPAINVALHIGNKVVRCIAMDSTDGLVRGMPVFATGNPISVPVGPKTLGRIFNVLGNTIDGGENLDKEVQ